MRQRGITLLGLFLAMGCGEGGSEVPDGEPGFDQASTAQDIRLLDASGDTLVLAKRPTRIIALIPSVNQVIVDLGATELLVGRTDYDSLSVLASLPSVGGGIGANLETMIALAPELVIGFHGASDARTRDRLQALGIPHLGVRPDGILDVRAIIEQVGQITGRETQAAAMVRAMDAQLDSVRAAVAGLPPVQAGYLLGGTPPLAAGPGTFLEELLTLAGATNVFGDLTELYAPVSAETILARQIDVLLLTEGAEVDARLLEGRRIVRIPSWVQVPGPALAEAAWLVARGIHSELADTAPPGDGHGGTGP